MLETTDISLKSDKLRLKEKWDFDYENYIYSFILFKMGKVKTLSQDLLI